MIFDFRCLTTVYDLQAQVSVVICYFNEALSTLLRTINTVFERTSPQLLKEIIVVDDGSSKGSNSFEIMFYILLYIVNCILLKIRARDWILIEYFIKNIT